MSEILSDCPPSVPVTAIGGRRWSDRALDVTAFFLADVADGLGPFLVIDLTSRRGWSSSEAGLALAMLLVGTVATQTLVGLWIDSTRRKRLAVAAAALVVALASVSLYSAGSRTAVYSLQILTGVTVAVIPPALAAISLGLVGREQLASRLGRNEACFHAGNVASAVMAAAANWCCGSMGIFYGVAVMAIASAISVLQIRERDLDHQLARGADSPDGHCAIVPLRRLLTDSRILWFTVAVVLFHFANAAMLPLVGQKVGHKSPESAATLMAVCIIVAQVTMVPVALLASVKATLSRRRVFLLGFAILPIRGLIYTLTDATPLLIANQILDGVGAGIFGVVSVLMMADLTRGTGRFNFAQGMVATAIGLGAAASNYLTGLIVDAGGYDYGFLFLSGIAVVAAVTFFVRVADTGPDSAPKKVNGV
ncbi:MFS transporter [Planctomyces sp. SH-PL14]|uniref:MFS transporter n=1 Tax=Planctomyces sp. SH-PL14 TaxID=1632864 RepID=UPI00078D97EF|nr:MFS transporter [Planctomyces sp. SH-PL14]AMV19173.1 multidrug resistance protein D [Planctomyces sp. SH-PL14]